VAHALQRDRPHPPPDDFRISFAELLGYIMNGQPEPSLLGSSPECVWAAELASLTFFRRLSTRRASVRRLSTRTFVPSARNDPRVSDCAWAVGAETTEEACAFPRAPA